MHRFALLVSLVALDACGCPTPDGVQSTAHRYSLQRDAACAAVPGCDPEFMRDVPVYEVPEQDIAELGGCPVGAVGCFCDAPGCPGVIFVVDEPVFLPGAPREAVGEDKLYDAGEILAHEYLHAAFMSTGVHTGTHPQFFKDALARVRSAL